MAQIMFYDQAVLLALNRTVNSWGIANRILAEYLVYLIPAVLVWLWFWQKKAQKTLLRVLFSVILAWPILSVLIGKAVNRPRPFDSGKVTELLFHRPTYSFPSDHAAAFFAVSAAFYYFGYKKLALMFLVLGVVNTVFRVAVGFHWPTDIIGGALVGVLAAYLVWLFDKPLSLLYDGLLKIARKIRLA